MTRPVSNLLHSITLMLGLAISLAAVPAAAAATEIVTPPPISGRNPQDSSAILPADVLARVELIKGNLELIRLYIGKAEPVQPVLRVSSARPREAYSQALNLQLRANRLAFEQARIVRPESQARDRDVMAYDVYGVVDSVLESVLLVKRELGIDGPVVEVPQPEDSTPADVFNAIVEAGSAINRLLIQSTGPSDTFQAVTAAVNIAAALHVALPNTPTLPEEPGFEPNKNHYDVFRQMQDCYTLIQALAQQKGIETLQFDVSDQQAMVIRQNDTSDLASLLVEELSSIHARSDARPAAAAYYPGKKFVAHIYQRVGLLKLILQDLVAASNNAREPAPTSSS